MHALEEIEAASSVIRAHLKEPLACCIVLGSGLGNLVDAMEGAQVVPYGDIPHFPTTSIPGHDGVLVLGWLGQCYVAVLKGRAHAYEGYGQWEVSFPMRVMHALGARRAIVTNACGGLIPELYLGALVILEDHINLSFSQPTIGQHLDHLGERFPDMTYAYSTALQNLAKKVAQRCDIKVHQGVYGGIMGPTYLSKAELKMLRRLGAQVVGMSTIPEVIVANQCKMEVLGISCVTDMVVPEALEPLDHDMVVRVANQTRPKFTKLLLGLMEDFENFKDLED